MGDHHRTEGGRDAELLETLRRFVEAMAGTFDVNAVVDELTRQTVKILDAYGAGVSVADDDGRLEFVSATDERIVEIERVQEADQAGPCVEAFWSGDVFAVTSGDDLERWPRYRAAADRSGLRSMIGVPLLAGDRRIGSLVVYDIRRREWNPLELHAARLLADMATAYLVHAREAADARRLMEQAALSEQRYRSLVEPSPDPVVRIGSDAVVHAANQAAEHLVGVGPPLHGANVEVESLVGRPIDELADRHPVFAAISQRWPLHVDGGLADPIDQVRFGRAGLADAFCRVRFVPVTGDGQTGEVLAIVTDITASVERESLLTRLALVDTLTGLPNRAAITDRLHVALDRLRPGSDRGGVAAMVIDLDYFKTINDAFGHAAGDEVLRAVGDSLGQSVRDLDSVGRMGGDEFIIVCERVADVAEAEALAGRVADALDKLVVEIGDATVEVSGSVGAALTHQSIEPAELLARADRAMLTAKTRRSNRHFAVDRTHRGAVMAAGALTRDIFGALDRDEFELHYQPIVDADGRLRRAEALLRWNHPSHGLLLPGQFLDVLMDSGFMGSIGQWVIRAAITHARQWHDTGAPIIVHVNVSPLELSSGAIEALSHALHDTGIDPRRVCIEVTEHAFTGSLLASNSIARLGELGVEIALDDFGTGAMTLSHLRQRPLHIVKLDREFIRSIDASGDPARNDRAILQGTIDIAHALGLALIAEGVENTTQLDWLRDTGCTLFQGWAFGQPVPAAELGLEGSSVPPKRRPTSSNNGIRRSS